MSKERLGQHTSDTTLFHALQQSRDMVCTYALTRQSIRSINGLENRQHAVRWMHEVAELSKMSSDARDTAVQVFDKFLSVSLEENDQVLVDTTYLSFTAAAAVILSAKLHEGKTLLTMANFPYFNTTDLVSFESRLLAKINYKMSPLATPSAFVRHLLSLGPCQEHAFLAAITAKADSYVAEFQIEPETMIYAPSTIAISSLLLSFSALDLDCSQWLSCVPDFCLPKAGNPLISIHGGELLDIDRCLVDFQRIPSIRSPRVSTPSSCHGGGSPSTRAEKSPTSVAFSDAFYYQEAIVVPPPAKETSRAEVGDGGPQSPFRSICSLQRK